MIETLLEFLRLESKLLHSITADGKKNFWVSFVLKHMVDFSQEWDLKCILDVGFWKLCKRNKVFVPTTKLKGL